MTRKHHQISLDNSFSIKRKASNFINKSYIVMLTSNITHERLHTKV